MTDPRALLPTTGTLYGGQLGACCGDDGCTCQGWVPLVDVSAIRVAELLTEQGVNTALARSVQRLIHTLDDPNGVISAFSSFVE